MIGAWTVAAFIRFETNGVATMQRLTTASQAANTSFLRQQKQITASEAALQNYQRRIDTLRASMRNFAARTAGIFAIGGLAAIVDATNQAAKLQTNMVGVGNATAATAEQLKRLQGFAFTLGNLTGQSPAEASMMIAQTARLVSGVAQFQAKGGGLNVAAFQRMMMNDVGKFAVIQNQSRGMDMNEAAVMGIKLAHMFHEFDPKGLHNMLGMATVINELMPDTLKSLLTQSKYFVPLMKTLHVSNGQALATYGLLDRYGMGQGRSGTAVANMLAQALGPLQITTHSQVVHGQLLEKMGLINHSGRSMFFNRKTNQFDFMAFAKQLSTYATKTPGDELVKEFTSVFGANARNLAALMSDKNFKHNLQSIENLEKNKDIGLDQQFAKYHTTFNYNFKRALANGQAIMTELAWPWLTGFSNWFKGLADKLHQFQAWLHANPDIEKRIGLIFGVLVAAAGAMSLRLGAALVTMPFKINAAAAAMDRLAVAVERAGVAAGEGAAAAEAGAAGAAGAAATAGVAGAIGIGGAALLLAGSTAVQVLAAQKGMDRLKHGANATENQQRGGYHVQHRFDAHGNLILGPQGGSSAPTQHVHIENLHLHANGDETDAGRKTGKFLSGLASNPQLTLSTGGKIRTSPRLAPGISIGNAAFGN